MADGITFAVENWHDVKDEALPLLIRHWEEIAADKAEIPLAIDYASYDALEAAGSLHILVARKNGAMVGYYCTVIRSHLHYVTTLFAFTDIFYIAPEHRGGAGIAMFREIEKSLKELGVKKFFSASKPWLDVGPLFERLGYTKHEVVYSKMIG